MVEQNSPDVRDAIEALAKQGVSSSPRPAAASKPSAPKKIAPRAAITPAEERPPIIDPAIANRRRASLEEKHRLEKRNEPPPISAGPVDKAIELAFNPTAEKIREVTIVDSVQAKLLPLLDTTNHMFQYVLEVASYRQNPDAYRDAFQKAYPEQPDVLSHLVYRMAQWQKSRGGKNLERITDIALAEVETKAQEEGGGLGPSNPYPD